MSEVSRAVFLSHASQDADVARKICEALRTAGVEVWFDQSEQEKMDVERWALRVEHSRTGP